MRRFLVPSFLLFAALSLHAAPPSLELAGPSGKKTVTADEIAKLPRTKVTIDDHGKSATFEGVELSQLLAMVDAPAGEHLRGNALMHYVVIEASDGYRALFALPELDAAFATRKVILADARDGKPLSEKEAPFRIAVEGEKKQARCVRMVTKIRLAAAE
ncbi:MAG: molybdopterin-dependent oxidoreductase [Acidobacteria bacterium]|nr:molybdopterin-dependent oxidoreductase [Acidobacteriota bacterium]